MFIKEQCFQPYQSLTVGTHSIIRICPGSLKVELFQVLQVVHYVTEIETNGS